jgi:lactate dehydrogenase-like 2-hydroxyacid dehydrogenase
MNRHTKPVVLMAPQLPEPLVAQLHERYTLLGPIAAGTSLPEGSARARALLTIGGLKTDAALMDALPSLGLIACYGTGHEGVDKAAAAARGIVVTNAGDANAISVAEFALGLMLALTRRIVPADRHARSGTWKGNAVERMPVVAGLAGRRLGIYGLGAIGARIAARAAAFDMEIGYHNRTPRSDVPYAYHASLHALAQWCDVLVVAARAGPGNRHAIDADVLAALGPSGHFVNISRGLVVEEAALCDALERGVVAGAALDVYEHEPTIPARLVALDNVVLTPHVAAGAESAQREQQRILLANLEAWFVGAPLANVVSG